ncbi:unnamed protein product, partial [Ixodes persulcatus]
PPFPTHSRGLTRSHEGGRGARRLKTVPVEQSDPFHNSPLQTTPLLPPPPSQAQTSRSAHRHWQQPSDSRLL